jgi:hypothetical protein
MSFRVMNAACGLMSNAENPSSSSKGSGEESSRAPEDPPVGGCSDARFDLVMNLKYLSIAYLAEALERPDRRMLSPTMVELLAVHLGTERGSIAALRHLGMQAGLAMAAPPRIDLDRGFGELADEAGLEGFDPFASEALLLTGALVLNSLGRAVLAAWLREERSVPWRPVLLPMLTDVSRFDGLLNGAMACLGGAAEDRARGLQALICGAFVCAGSGERLWSFDLLEIAISRLACGGSMDRRGGFFPDGMSGS